MEKTLKVYLLGKFAGILTQDINSQLSFQYESAYLENPTHLPLSHSLPLRTEPFSNRECRGYFSGLLPEGEIRSVVARNLGISAGNDFAMLQAIGGECAGAASFVQPNIQLDDEELQYQTLTEDELATLIRSLPERPLLAGNVGVRLSLAGAQEKIAVAIHEHELAIPLGSSPSTHIIKPDLSRFPGIIYNEALCMQLARSIGMNTAEARICYANEVPYLLVKRYDRIDPEDEKHPVMRLHQEDFCQALGIVSDRKYQQEGGPSLVACFRLLRDTSSLSALDLQQLLDAVIFNYCIGNHDAHAKNFSLLYTTHASGQHRIRLAPFYDLISTAYYPALSNQMAMAIGDKYLASEVLHVHFELMAKGAGLTPALVKTRIKNVANLILNNLSEVSSLVPSTSELEKFIQGRVERVLQKMG